MDNEIKGMVDLEIQRVLKILENHVPGSDDYNAAMTCLNKLYALRMDEIKTEKEYEEKRAKRVSDECQHHAELAIKDRQIDVESEVKREQIRVDAEIRKTENAIKSTQVKQEQSGQYWKIGLGIGEVVLPLTFYAIWMYCGFRFEEHGSIVSPTFKGLIQKFKPTRK
jgi:hypothetical protein